MAETVKETKAQRAERLKRALNPWAAYAETSRRHMRGQMSLRLGGTMPDFTAESYPRLTPQPK